MRNSSAKKIYAIFALSGIFTLSLSLPAYINSSFLEQFVPEKFIGAIFSIAAFFAIFFLAGIPRALRAFGSFDTAFSLMVLSAALLLGLAVFRSPLIAIILFLIYEASYSLLAFEMDLLLERYSEDKKTGRIRGAYLTIANIAWILGPLSAGFILGNAEYYRVFAVAALLMLVFTFIFIRNFKSYHDPRYSDLPFWHTLKELYGRRSLFNIFIVQLLLQSFFAWMIVYTPLYLHGHLGMSWQTLGIIFTVMLLPYVLLEYILGKLADTRFGEKEILSTGLVIMGTSAIALSFIATGNPFLWAGMLFITRVGAAMVESMSESNFFKQIDGRDSKLISLFRMTGPLSYILSPLLATISLFFIDLKYSFIVLGSLVLCGLYFSLRIKDSK